jgi:hypothetical protein
MLNPTATYPVERRLRRERRGLRAQLTGFKLGRRRKLRRTEDRRKMVLLDQYPRHLLAATVTILMLSLSDAFLTLVLISHGAIELNPIMDYLLKAGPIYFVVVKYGLTAGAVTIVLLFHYYPFRGLNMPVRSLLSVFTLIFAMVMAWQIYLLIRFVL